MASPCSSSSDSSQACECGRDGGDGGTNRCQDCSQWVCSNKCRDMPGIVHTDQGTYCTDCVSTIVLIYPDPVRPMEYLDEDGELVSDTLGDYLSCQRDQCDRCGCNVYRDEFISLADCLICRDCLTIVVKEACGK